MGKLAIATGPRKLPETKGRLRKPLGITLPLIKINTKQLFTPEVLATLKQLRSFVGRNKDNMDPQLTGRASPTM